MDSDKHFQLMITLIIIVVLVILITSIAMDQNHQRMMADKGLCWIGNTYLPCDVTKK
jgi:hypothetical protein